MLYSAIFSSKFSFGFKFGEIAKVCNCLIISSGFSESSVSDLKKCRNGGSITL